MNKYECSCGHKWESPRINETCPACNPGAATMSGPRNVVIDGVVYVPVTEAVPTMRQIARGILASFYGDITDAEIDEKMDGITVSVNDWGDGEPIENILRDIAEVLKEPPK